VLRGPTGSGYFAREALQHELLHVAQYLRNPAIRDVGPVRWFHELAPAYVGSPTIYIPPTVGTGVLIKKAYSVTAEYNETSWGQDK